MTTRSSRKERGTKRSAEENIENENSIEKTIRNGQLSVGHVSDGEKTAVRGLTSTSKRTALSDISAPAPDHPATSGDNFVVVSSKKQKTRNDDILRKFALFHSPFSRLVLYLPPSRIALIIFFFCDALVTEEELDVSVFRDSVKNFQVQHSSKRAKVNAHEDYLTDTIDELLRSPEEGHCSSDKPSKIKLFKTDFDAEQPVSSSSSPSSSSSSVLSSPTHKFFLRTLGDIAENLDAGKSPVLFFVFMCFMAF